MPVESKNAGRVFSVSRPSLALRASHSVSGVRKSV
jgi:hypothetical protein